MSATGLGVAVPFSSAEVDGFDEEVGDADADADSGVVSDVAEWDEADTVGANELGATEALASSGLDPLAGPYGSFCNSRDGF